MTTELKEKVELWLTGGYDQDTKDTIKKLMASNPSELDDAFYKNLEFGTGGMRGIMGVGTNRINKYTVGGATQALSNYLNEQIKDRQIKVAVAFDSRNNSQELAQIVANVFSANNIKVYLYESLRPTPQLSFTIRELGCDSGVVLTASHNPKEYNGYKAYWNDGSQVVAPHDKRIIDAYNAIQSVDQIKFEAKKDLIELVGESLDNAFIEKSIENLNLTEDQILDSDTKIVYSPLHGTGIKIIPEALKRAGFHQVNIVEEQALPNGNFPTVVYPNPEESEAMKISLEYAEKLKADLIFATDPDTDRVGIALPNLEGEYELLNGNQTAAIIFDYMIKNSRKNETSYVAKTIVTSELIKNIADQYNVECLDTLTGFKYIANEIREKEKTNAHFICGAEESYGYMIGDFVRDKDAVTAAVVLSEIAADNKLMGQSIYEYLVDIYMKNGFFLESLMSITKKGKEGKEAIEAMMQKFRSEPPISFGGEKITKIIDYKNLTIKNLEVNSLDTFEFEKSNVVQFFTEKGTKISARPSGTEPKIKFYFSVKTNLESKEAFKTTKQNLENQIDRIKKDLIDKYA